MKILAVIATLEVIICRYPNVICNILIKIRLKYQMNPLHEET